MLFLGDFLGDVLTVFRLKYGSVALAEHQISFPVFERIQNDVPDPKCV
ncbi:hypothetical protein XBKB1_1240029 [Xenorhabdus bovienii str. kraussei Becker Underwood]|uniref:Uncharacterized protein n=1 Tax=Xenorhabdus bovienii str. kraussei Becker Underwood TaxID=1398204 RepID=A0A077PPU3_XENBV|nr:hypothetical protein XBKB1_1240029 [Xenorhabdus bovienii str. kraussei Becker Underwood]